MYLQKSLKNIYPTVWHLDFTILLTWQKEEKDWHICQACSHLVLENWREVRVRLRVEVARVWRHPAARLSYELPIGLSSTSGTPSMPSQLFVFLPIGLPSTPRTPSMLFGSFLLAKTPAAKLWAAMHKWCDLSASAEINLPRTFTRHAGRRKARQKNCVVHNFLFCQVINTKPLEICLFSPLPYFFETWQTTSFAKPIMQNGLRCSKQQTLQTGHEIHCKKVVGSDFV